MYYKTIVIDGKEYFLVPVEEQEPIIIEEKNPLIDDYVGEKSEEKALQTGNVKQAIPQVSEYRERYKKQELTPLDVMALPKLPKLVKTDADLDRFTYKGDKLFFGTGIEGDLI